MSLSDETIEAVRARADVVAVISKYVTLKQRGRSYLGLCPFHTEKTPSFNVSPERQGWHCFGCGAGGNVFTFLMRMEGLSFPEAVERLAQQVGVEIQRDPAAARRRGERQQILDANQAAADFFRQQLARSAAAREFVRRRGLSDESVAALGLGYAPGNDLLATTLQRRGIPAELLQKAGLARQRENGSLFDMFRDRVIFPIRNVDGTVVAFGGRALGDGQPKYLNSPETPVFDKGRTLYGLDRARRAIADAGYAIVVEGYMDVAMVQQAGLLPVVATLGTALRSTHLELLRRYAPRVVLAYDGDAAGAAAAERSLALFEDAEMEGRILILPEGRDPDEWIRAHGVEAFRQRVEQAVPLVEYQLRRLTERADWRTPEGRGALAQAVAPVLAGIRSAVKREEYVSRLAEEWCAGQMHRVREMEEAIRREVQRGGLARVRRPSPAVANAERPAARATESVPALPRRVIAAEQFVLQGLLYGVEAADKVLALLAPEDFQVEAHRRLAAALWRWGNAPEAIEAIRGAAMQDEAVAAVLSQLDLQQEKWAASEKSVMDSLRAIKERQQRARITSLLDQLARPEQISGEERSRMEKELLELKKQVSDLYDSNAGWA